MNFESATVRSGSQLDTVDWHLDLWIGQDGRSHWKDEDEAEAALSNGHLTAEDLAVARATGEALLGDVDALIRDAQ